jgi:hypothetical protein
MGKLAENLKVMSLERQVYSLQVMPELLAQNSRYDRLYIVLTDFDFIESKILKLGTKQLIADYDLFFTPDAMRSEDWSEAKGQKLRAVQGVLRSLPNNTKLLEPVAATIQELLALSV